MTKSKKSNGTDTEAPEERLERKQIADWLSLVRKMRNRNDPGWNNGEIADLISKSLGYPFPSSTLSKLFSGERGLRGREAHVLEHMFGYLVPFPWRIPIGSATEYGGMREDQAVWGADVGLNSVPDLRTDKHLQKIDVTDNDVAPRYIKGEIAWASYKRDAIPGEDVYVELIDRKTSETIRIIRKFVSLQKTTYALRKWHSDAEETCDRSDVIAIRPILWLQRS